MITADANGYAVCLDTVQWHICTILVQRRSLTLWFIGEVEQLTTAATAGEATKQSPGNPGGYTHREQVFGRKGQ